MLSAPAFAENCHPMMPEQSSIQGTLSKEVFPGPPNYKSIEAGDKAETYYFLNLPAPVCLTIKAKDVAAPSSSKVQLIFSGDALAMYKKLLPHMGAEVRCTGAFFTPHLPRHHAQVLMRVSDCEPVAGNSTIL